MRQTIKEIEVNMAYRWFLGSIFTIRCRIFQHSARTTKEDLKGPICSTRFPADTAAVYEMRSDKHGYDICRRNTCKSSSEPEENKEHTGSKEKRGFYDEKLKAEINADRIAHGKKPLKEKDDKDDRDDNDRNSGSGQMDMSELKEQKQSITDPESGWFHKGEHKEVFAYSIETACDENGWILDYSVHPGNEHDSKTFPELYEKLKKYAIKTMVIGCRIQEPCDRKAFDRRSDHTAVPIQKAHDKERILPEA